MELEKYRKAQKIIQLRELLIKLKDAVSYKDDDSIFVSLVFEDKACNERNRVVIPMETKKEYLAGISCTTLFLLRDVEKQFKEL